MERDLAELEKGLDTLVGPRGVKLSGGQVQRTAAARMFVREPSCWSSTTSPARWMWKPSAAVGANLFENTQASTCLVVSHRRPVLRRADHILVMKDGQGERGGHAG